MIWELLFVAHQACGFLLALMLFDTGFYTLASIITGSIISSLTVLILTLKTIDADSILNDVLKLVAHISMFLFNASAYIYAIVIAIQYSYIDVYVVIGLYTYAILGIFIMFIAIFFIFFIWGVGAVLSLFFGNNSE